MGGFFSSPSDLERQATANMYRNFSPTASGSNSAATNTSGANSTPTVNSGTPTPNVSARKNRKNTQYGGKRKNKKNRTTKRR
jgi:hypothetical protein